jgi:acyl-CoA dehydrogenase
MDFSLPPEIEAFRLQVRDFVEREILPLEGDPESYDAHENINHETLQALRGKAKAAGLWAPQMPKARGGLGFSTVAMAAAYEEMNRSIFGPAAFNCAAPDDGNMILLNRVATEPQKDRWLQPIIDGAVRSAFVMTEPAPGSGSDPAAMMLTTAKRQGDRWRVEGRKWFITGAEEAGHFILVARTSDDPRKGLTAFLFDRDQPGWEIARRIPIMGPEEHGGHCELNFDGLEIPDENRLMEVGEGLKVTQIRLGTARLTHCMRWLGLAKRALEIASEYVAEREAFGSTLADHEGVQWMLGEAAMEIQVGRLLTMHAAWKLDQGDFARKEVSMAKVAVADILHKAVDTAIQLCGARGYSKDTVLEWIYRYARQARLVDGASEVHKMVLARQLQTLGRDFWAWGYSQVAAADLQLQGIQQHGEEHQGAADHLHVLGRQAHDVDRGVDGAQQQHAGEDPAQAPDAALQADAADHHGREGLEQHAEAQVGRGAVGPDRQEPAGKSGQHAGQHEDPDHQAVHVDAGAERRHHVAADQVDVPAEGGALQDEVEQEIDRHQDQHHERDAQEVDVGDRAQLRRQAVDRAAAGQHQAQPAHPDEGGQGHDERADLQAGHQIAVAEAEGGADRQGDGQGQPGIDAQCQALAAAGHQDAGDHGREGHHRFDGKIQMAADQDQAQADRQDAHEGGLAQDVDEDPDLEELVDGQGKADQDDH